MTRLAIETETPDGTAILIREVGPEDADLLRVGFSHLSGESRYFRFLGRVERLTDAQIEEFTARNDADHIAIGVLADGKDPVAIARHIRLPTRPDRSEYAITVIDRFQGRGIGSLLLGVLATCVRAEGITGFEGLVHRRNHAMRRIVADLGGTEKRIDAQELAVSIPILDDPDAYPATRAGDAMRRAHALCAVRPPD